MCFVGTKNLCVKGIILVNTLLVLLCLNVCADWQFRTSNRLLGNGYFNPGDEELLPRDNDVIAAFENRLIVAGDLSDAVATEVHLLTTLDYSTRRLQAYTAWPFSSSVDRRTAFRHSELDWTWKDTDTTGRAVKGVTTIDRLTLQWNTDRIAVTLGRQAIGLSTCFYLTTNDYFQPFAPEATYREYKTGVDALNLQWFTGDLSEIDVIAVAGYDGDDDVDWDESALIARSVFSAGNFEWTVMGGKLPWRWTVAGALQGELARFGVRAEFNINFPDDGWDAAFGALNDDTYTQVAGGIDYRFDSSLHLFLEYLYRDHGEPEYRDYLLRTVMLDMTRESFSAQNYLSLAATYQWHPLITSQLFGIGNLDDQSALVTGTVNYSLADEADLIFGGTVTIGDEPKYTGSKTPDIPSQYGAAADSIYAELRVYL